MARKVTDSQGYNDVLMIHLGGLGDMCLSESTFFSLSQHFQDNLVALGAKRFLRLLEDYFESIESIESRRWLYLFAEDVPGRQWRRIVFIGKDRRGLLRRRWQSLSREPVLFVDMYPESAFNTERSAFSENNRSRGTPNSELPTAVHIEDYQLMQLPAYGVRALKKEVVPRRTSRVILYPEKGYEKKKWPPEHFVELYQSLKSKGADVHIVESLGLTLNIKDKLIFQDIIEVRDFLRGGGIFVSNDSGMAHLAGTCGLFTITVFADFDPDIWHPRGEHRVLMLHEGTNVPSLEAEILTLPGTLV